MCEAYEGTTHTWGPTMEEKYDCCAVPPALPHSVELGAKAAAFRERMECSREPTTAVTKMVAPARVGPTCNTLQVVMRGRMLRKWPRFVWAGM